MAGKRLIPALLLIASCRIASGDPFAGVWILNLSKSNLPPPLPVSETLRIEADAGSIRIREETVNAAGIRLQLSVDAGFDGKEYPVIGSPFADTISYQRVDSRTLNGVARKRGRVVVTETAAVSQDGRTLTGTYTSTDASGRPVTGVAVFDKQ